jgi:hypothetical protein
MKMWPVAEPWPGPTCSWNDIKHNWPEGTKPAEAFKRAVAHCINAGLITIDEPLTELEINKAQAKAKNFVRQQRKLNQL